MPTKPETHRPRHAPQRADYDRRYNRTRRDPATERMRKSARWRALRGYILNRTPLCLRCQREGVTRPATQIHHKIPAQERPDLFFEVDNLEPICDPCHAKASAEERRG